MVFARMLLLSAETLLMSIHYPWVPVFETQLFAACNGLKQWGMEIVVLMQCSSTGSVHPASTIIIVIKYKFSQSECETDQTY